METERWPYPLDTARLLSAKPSLGPCAASPAPSYKDIKHDSAYLFGFVIGLLTR